MHCIIHFFLPEFQVQQGRQDFLSLCKNSQFSNMHIHMDVNNISIWASDIANICLRLIMNSFGINTNVCKLELLLLLDLGCWSATLPSFLTWTSPYPIDEASESFLVNLVLLDGWPVSVVWSLLGRCSMEVVRPLLLLSMLLVYCFTCKQHQHMPESNWAHGFSQSPGIEQSIVGLSFLFRLLNFSWVKYWFV